MFISFQRVPLFLELFFNGIFIIVYSLRSLNKLPEYFTDTYSNIILEFGSSFVPFIILISIISNYIYSESFDEFVRKYIFSVVVFIPLIIVYGDIEFCFWLASAHLLSSILTLYEGDSPKYHTTELGEPLTPLQNFFRQIKLRPAQIVLFSFIGVILIGTFLLMLPVASKGGGAMKFVDAIFMATSATCVTGLTTISVNQDLSAFGQIVMLILIQIGGLGIMTLSSSMTILLGKSMGMKDRIIMQDLLDVSSLEDLFAMITDIIRYTLLIELWGAIVLTFAFTYEGFDFTTSLYYGFFHSISAFCNAGFSLFDTSLESYAVNPLIHGTISILVTFGGLGFIVIKELREILTKRSSFVRITLHTKIVLITSFLLTLLGMLFIFFGEFLNALDGFTLYEKLQISFFQSVTLRTAGFNTLPMTNLNTFTIYGMALFMFIGASPGSTGGGIKTTTFAILIQSIKSTLVGKNEIEFFDRTIPSSMVVRATALTFISIIITSFFILVLMKLEPNQSFLPLFFEVISASGTVGLTLGVTPFLTTMGKMALALLMLIGRIGPLTLVLAIGEKRQKSGKFDYPDGRIMIG